MSSWANKRMYRVNKVRVDLNPLKAKFKVSNDDTEVVTVKEYFKSKYGIDLDP